MKKHRTAKKNRNEYVYTSCTGTEMSLKPSQDGVTDADITTLHRLDDDEWNNDQKHHRNDRKTVTSVISYDDADPSDAIFGDSSADPLEILITEEMQRETLAEISEALRQLTEAQFKAIIAVRLRGLSAREYAKQIGKTEASVSKNLKSATIKLKKLLGK